MVSNFLSKNQFAFQNAYFKNIKTAIDSNIAWGIQVVINKGINLQHIEIDGMNCLVYAIKKNRPQIISILLENNCTKYINQVDISNNKNTPLIDAIKVNSPEIVKILLKNNANVEKEDKVMIIIIIVKIAKFKNIKSFIIIINYK